jgi:23S rRNA pseudouridine1911/1915/1917 synthase
VSIEIIKNNKNYIAVIKPVGILSQGDKSGDPALVDLVQAKIGWPTDKKLHLIHRLDRPVAGIVLLAKNAKSADHLSEQFRKSTIVKTYYAIVEGMPDEERGRLCHYLKKDKKKNRTRATVRPEPSSQKAITHYEIVSTDTKKSLLKIVPETGRPHQIRSQLSAIGHPVYGDLKYGAKKGLPDRSIYLFAGAIEFEGFDGEGKVLISANLPKSWPMKI